MGGGQQIRRDLSVLKPSKVIRSSYSRYRGAAGTREPRREREESLGGICRSEGICDLPCIFARAKSTMIASRARLAGWAGWLGAHWMVVDAARVQV